jgi:hypothetical protein
MKISITVNLGSYESIRIETSEYPNLKLCLMELDKTLTFIGSDAAIKFRNNYIRPALTRMREAADSG